MTRVLLHCLAPDGPAEALRAALPEVEVATCDTYADLPDALARVQPDAVYGVRFAGSVGYPRDVLMGPGGPRWLAVGGAGTDHLGQWDTDRITVTNAAGVAADMMAEYVIAGFLHFALDVPGMIRDQATRVWNSNRRVRPLQGQTLVIVGLGHTGRAVAQRAKALGMRVLGTRARPAPTDHVDEVHASERLIDLLPQADFIAVCLPLTPQTRGALGAAELAVVKPGAILADVSRGGVIVAPALLDALRSGRLGGAALDVFETEPLPPESPFWTLDTVLISPHCSAVHAGWEAASFALFLDNLKRFCAGSPLMNVVDPARGY